MTNVTQRNFCYQINTKKYWQHFQTKNDPVQFSRNHRKTLFFSRTRRIMKQPLFSHITIAFIAPVVFLCCTNNRDGYSHRLIFFHDRSIFWKTLFSLPSLLDFLTFVLVLSTGDCNFNISEQVITR